MTRSPVENILVRGLHLRTLPDCGASGILPTAADSGTIQLVSAGPEARTLNPPNYEGQIISLICKTYGGDITVTCATKVDQAAHGTLTFGAQDDLIILIGVERPAGKRWAILSNDGVGVT